jgi:hypothetical protein
MQLFLLLIFLFTECCFCQMQHHNSQVSKNHHNFMRHSHSNQHFTFVSNRILSGLDKGCNFRTRYVTTTVVNFDMGIGQSNQDLKNGMSIISLRFKEWHEYNKSYKLQRILTNLPSYAIRIGRSRQFWGLSQFTSVIYKPSTYEVTSNQSGTDVK